MALLFSGTLPSRFLMRPRKIKKRIDDNEFQVHILFSDIIWKKKKKRSFKRRSHGPEPTTRGSAARDRLQVQSRLGVAGRGLLFFKKKERGEKIKKRDQAEQVEIFFSFLKSFF